MTRARKHILIVEDDRAEREALTRVLKLERYDVASARDAPSAFPFAEQPVDFVISDLCLNNGSGLDVLRHWRERRLATPFLLVTAFGTIEIAVEAMKLGACDFLTKPVDPVRLLGILDRVLGGYDAPGEHASLDEINRGLGIHTIIGRTRALAEVCSQTLRVAPSTSTVLILGESGTGKELIANALHRHSKVREGPFVVANMAAIPETLVESELFGHVKGAFTHAVARRVGRFEEASGGTLLIDEIGDFPLHVQAKLLRVLESRVVTPLGSNQAVPINTRVVAATSRPIKKMVQEGTFREDLYYRLNVVELHLPPLRERRQDIPALVQHFLEEFANSAGRRSQRVSDDLMRLLQEFDWPGNVRQLRNCIERISVMSRGDVATVADLPLEFLGFEAARSAIAADAGSRLDSLQKSAILKALDQFDGNRTRAAAFLGISVRTLQRRLLDWSKSGDG